MHHYHKIKFIDCLGVEYAVVCAQVPQFLHVPQVAHAGVDVSVAYVVVDIWIVLYERNKFSIENSYIVSSRTIHGFIVWYRIR